MALISVREHAHIGISKEGAHQQGMDLAWVPAAAFTWLCAELERLRVGGAALLLRDGQQWLRLDSHVGVMQCPDGTTLEILPKHVHEAQSPTQARQVLKQMLVQVLDLTPRESAPAALALFDMPLNEWVMARFLAALDHLVRRGIRFDYSRVQEEQPFLRGQLQVAQQMRQSPARAHLFSIEHDVFEADRAENRLLRSALDRVCTRTRNPGNWRLAHELSGRLATLPRSRHVAADLRAWRQDRLMAHYRDLRPLCALILSGQSPLALVGDWESPSLLFPMERLFERYVRVCLARQFAPEWQLATPPQTHLCQHVGQGWFALMPDIVMRRGGVQWLLDAKWKLLDGAIGGARKGYGLKQADIYQMFAYGHRHDSGGGLALVYPMHSGFNTALPPFEFDAQRCLQVLPFDLAQGRLIVPGCWPPGNQAADGPEAAGRR